MKTTLHATCVAIDGRGVMLTGTSGSGKSDLALRLIDRGATLVSDDCTVVEARDGRLYASAGPNIQGKIEVRGLGIMELPARADVPLCLEIMLDQPVPRMPDDPPSTHIIGGLAIPALALDPFCASTPVKVEKALALYGLGA
jgi:hypothetical protein